jgi:hypothetical protein
VVKELPDMSPSLCPKGLRLVTESSKIYIEISVQQEFLFLKGYWLHRQH